MRRAGAMALAVKSGAEGSRYQYALVFGVAVVAAIGSAGVVDWAVLIAVVLGIPISGLVATRIAAPADRRWLTKLLPIAYGTHLVGAYANLSIAESRYDGADARVYHETASSIAESLSTIGEVDLGVGSIGTRAVSAIAGFLYLPLQPSQLGGYVIFSTMAFLGLTMSYVAFRTVVGDRRILAYFASVFFLPSLILWPSAIGKDALMALAIGGVSLSAARWSSRLTTRPAGSLPFIGLAALIRPHIAVILATALLAAHLVRLLHDGILDVRAVAAALALCALLFLAGIAALDRIGASGVQSLAEISQATAERTSRGSSSFDAEPIQSPVQIPGGFVSVVARPYPTEAETPFQFVASLEGVFLLALSFWTIPAIWRNRSRFLTHPYFTYTLTFLLLFVIGFSSVSNLGILARQRAQVLPILLTLIFGFAFDGSHALREGRP